MTNSFVFGDSIVEEALKESFDELTHENESLKLAMNEASQASERLSTELKELDALYKKLSANYNQLQGQQFNLVNENQSLRVDLNKEVELLNKLQQQQSSLESENQSLGVKFKELSALHEKMLLNYNQLQDQRSNLVDDNESLRARLNELEEKNKSLQSIKKDYDDNVRSHEFVSSQLTLVQNELKHQYDLSSSPSQREVFAMHLIERQNEVLFKCLSKE